ncbi:MAG: CHAD domain-containing protein [Gammaproteobacteria bacterium]
MATSRLKPLTTVSPASPAPRAWARVLDAYTRALRAQERAILADGNPDAVHDYRVLLRALRGLFKASRAMFDAHDRERFKADFRWLGERTSPIRDLDVFAVTWPAYVAHDPILAARLAPALDATIAAARASHFRNLIDVLRSPRYRTLHADWSRTLARLRKSPVPEGENGSAGAHVAAHLQRLARRMRKPRRRHLREPAALHALRKDGKALRYLVEAFATIFEPAARDTALGCCKQLQSVLGDYWDTEVHHHLLQSLDAPLTPADRRALRDALTLAARTRSTHVMHAIRDFQRAFEPPPIRVSRGRRRA